MFYVSMPASILEREFFSQNPHLPYLSHLPPNKSHKILSFPSFLLLLTDCERAIC